MDNNTPKRKSKFTPKRFEQNHNITPNPPLKELAGLLLSALGLVVLVYIFITIALEIMIPAIPAETENWMWEQMGARLPISLEDRTAQEDQLQALLDSLPAEVKPEGYKFTVHVIDSEHINAFAYPGGHILLTKAMLDQMGSENALVFILGHELGHFENRDHLRGLGHGLAGLIIGLALLGQSSEFTQIISGLTLSTQLAFSRKQEEKADIWGVKTLMAHYGHAAGAKDLFKTLIEKKKNNNYDIPQFFSTHPASQQRIKKMNAYISENAFPIGSATPLSLQ